MSRVWQWLGPIALALVAVMSKDLSSAYRFLQIAEVHKEASQRNKVLEWDLRGLMAFAEAPDEGLENFVADECHRRRHHGEAMALIWGQFERRPGLSAYTHLKEHADRADHRPPRRQCGTRG